MRIRNERMLLPELTDWFDGFPGLLAWRVPQQHAIRVEDYLAGGSYVVRAELPGIDPAKDLTVTVGQGLLTLEVRREAETHESGHSEFRYGTFIRTLTLPVGAHEDQVSAEYVDGLLTVTVKVAGAPAVRSVVIRQPGKETTKVGTTAT